jgi:DNA mismatch repair protein MutS2
MNEDLFKTLEFNAVRQMLASRSPSALSRQMALSWVPSTHREIIEGWLTETEEASICLEREISTPLGETHDVHPVVEKAEKDITASAQEFIDLGATLDTYQKMRQYFDGERHLMYPALEELVMTMVPMDGLQGRIHRTFDDHGEIKDDASPKLYRIRTEMAAIKGRLRRSLQRILHDRNQAVYFQDAIITQRNGRYVLPIKEEYRYKFDGIVHDRSSTGQTLFMEPVISVQLNNDLAECMASEKEEIHQIFLQITHEINKNREDILHDCQIATRLEFIFARGRLALDMHGVKAVMSRQGVVDLRNARHPLIPADKVVPVSLPLGIDYRILVITGSNAGGKTIAIKTLGLLALMNQAGLFIPASEGSSLPVFENIYAIIGDDQSIQYNLSTFSSYITKLTSFLDRCGSRDLVLLDELGSGTDPVEGAALAESVTEYLYKKHVPSIITSHFSEMKKLAYETEGIENAFVEFDEKTLMPTYHLIIGVAGNSNAFSICRRLGLSSHVIERAEELKQNSPYHHMEDVMAELNVEMQRVEKEKMHLADMVREAESLRNDLKQESRILFDKRREILDKTREESENIKRQLRVESEAIIKDLKKMSAHMERGSLNKKIAGVRGRVNDMKLPDLAADTGEKPVEDIKPGDWVYIDTLSSDGQVTAVSGKKITVQCGIISAAVDRKHCFPPRSGHEKKVRESSKIRLKKNYRDPGVRSVATSINLLGKTVDEAIPEVDRFLNDAFMAGISPVQIIHGKGTGSLRAGIHEYLRTLPFVSEFKLADARNGGAGVTEVYF